MIKKDKKITKKKIKYIFLGILLITLISSIIFVGVIIFKHNSVKEILKLKNGNLITATEVEKTSENDKVIKKISLINDVFFDISNINVDNKDNKIKEITLLNFDLENKEKENIKLIAPSEKKTILFNKDEENYIDSKIKYQADEDGDTKIAFRLYEFGYKSLNENEDVKLTQDDVNSSRYNFKLKFDIKVKLESNKEYMSKIEVEFDNKNIVGNEKVEKELDLTKYNFQLFQN